MLSNFLFDHSAFESTYRYLERLKRNTSGNSDNSSLDFDHIKNIANEIRTGLQSLELPEGNLHPFEIAQMANLLDDVTEDTLGDALEQIKVWVRSLSRYDESSVDYVEEAIRVIARAKDN